MLWLIKNCHKTLPALTIKTKRNRSAIKMERICINPLRPLAFLPKAIWISLLAGLLTRSALTPSHLRKADSGNRLLKLFLELTAAGTVPDFHRIPF